MMNLFSAAERLAAIDRSEVVFDAGRCLHNIDRFAQCQACVDICPVQAVQVGKPPSLDHERCENCLACMPSCPVGAFSADDEVTPLLTSFAHLQAKRVELVCARDPHPELGLPDSDIAVFARGCFASFGYGAFFSLASLEPAAIVVRTDACHECAWSSLHDFIEGQVALANLLLAVYTIETEITCLNVLEPDQAVERPLIDAHNPPLSRRDFFSLASRQGRMAAARAIANAPAKAGAQPNRERLRLQAALANAAPDSLDFSGKLNAPGFASLAVTKDCSACGVCSKVCPTGALDFQRIEEKGFQLSIHPLACTGCEVCKHFCSVSAIQIDHEPRFDQVFQSLEPVVLLDGSLARCAKCKTLFNAASGANFCPICSIQRKNLIAAAPIYTMKPVRSKKT